MSDNKAAHDVPRTVAEAVLRLPVRAESAAEQIDLTCRHFESLVERGEATGPAPDVDA